MKHLIHIVLLLVYTACSSSKLLSEHEVVCHISGEGFDVKNVRICLVWTDMWNGDAYPWPNMVALEGSHHIWTQYGCPDKAGRTLLIDKNGIIVKIDPSIDEIEQYIKENI
jgi:hypothetical protein